MGSLVGTTCGVKHVSSFGDLGCAEGSVKVSDRNVSPTVLYWDHIIRSVWAENVFASATLIGTGGFRAIPVAEESVCSGAEIPTCAGMIGLT